MGYCKKESIEKGAQFVFSILKTKDQFRIGEIYNDEEGSEELLAVLIDNEDCGIVFVECAICQLVDLGLCHRKNLDQLLIDGQPDYLVSLTKKSKSLRPDFKDVTFVGMDL